MKKINGGRQTAAPSPTITKNRFNSMEETRLRRENSLRLLAQVKEREATQKMVTVKIGHNTWKLVPKEKAIILKKTKK